MILPLQSYDDEDICPEENVVIDPRNTSRWMPIKGVLDQDGLIEHLEKPVYMMGRTSGFSEGILDGACLAAFTIKFSNGKKYLYGDLNFVIPSYNGIACSAPGDSGALVYTESGLAAGFLVGATHKGSLFHPAFSCLQHIDGELI